MFGKTATAEKAIVVFDIGSGSAATSIIVCRHGAPAQILAAARSILPLEDRSREQTMRGVINMISESSASALKAYQVSDTGKRLGKPSAVYAIVRAPWTRASAGRSLKSFQQDELITKKLITELAQEAFEGDHELDRGNILETSVTRVELNEYPTAKPIGKKAHRLGVITFESDCDPVMHKAIVDSINSLFPGLPLTVRSGARAFLSTIQDGLKHPGAYVIVDMVSEATTYMAVRDGVISHHAVVPEGVRNILKKVAGAQGMPDEILNLMRMVVAGSCTGEVCDALNTGLARVEPELMRSFGEAVGGFVGKRRLPDTLILTAHPDITTWLGHLFSRIDFAQFTVSMRPFNVHIVTKDELKDFVVAEPHVVYDIGMAITAAFVNNQEQVA